MSAGIGPRRQPVCHAKQPGCPWKMGRRRPGGARRVSSCGKVEGTKEALPRCWRRAALGVPTSTRLAARAGRGAAAGNKKRGCGKHLGARFKSLGAQTGAGAPAGRARAPHAPTPAGVPRCPSHQLPARKWNASTAGARMDACGGGGEGCEAKGVRTRCGAARGRCDSRPARAQGARLRGRLSERGAHRGEHARGEVCEAQARLRAVDRKPHLARGPGSGQGRRQNPWAGGARRARIQGSIGTPTTHAVPQASARR